MEFELIERTNDITERRTKHELNAKQYVTSSTMQSTKDLWASLTIGIFGLLLRYVPATIRPGRSRTRLRFVRYLTTNISQLLEDNASYVFVLTVTSTSSTRNNCRLSSISTRLSTIPPTTRTFSMYI